MAIKEQCYQCDLFEEGLCKLHSAPPEYDWTSCFQYIKQGEGMERTERKGMFDRPFSFKGRITRSEWWLSQFIAAGYMFVVYIILYILGNRAPMASEFVAFVLVVSLLLPYYWFLCSQNARRCHDRGNSGWFQFIPFYVLWMAFGGGDKGDNMYGPNPR